VCVSVLLCVCVCLCVRVLVCVCVCVCVRERERERERESGNQYFALFLVFVKEKNFCVCQGDKLLCLKVCKVITPSSHTEFMTRDDCIFVGRVWELSESTNRCVLRNSGVVSTTKA
jgi:hypothetical protein